MDGIDTLVKIVHLNNENQDISDSITIMSLNLYFINQRLNIQFKIFTSLVLGNDGKYIIRINVKNEK